MRKYYVYIMNNPTGTIYIGMTNDLLRRVFEHKHKLIKGFTKKYNVTRLVYFEETTDVNAAINREKEIKGWRRSKKIDLIKSLNPKWEDLAEDWFDEDDLQPYSWLIKQDHLHILVIPSETRDPYSQSNVITYAGT